MFSFLRFFFYIKVYETNIFVKGREILFSSTITSNWRKILQRPTKKPMLRLHLKKLYDKRRYSPYLVCGS